MNNNNSVKFDYRKLRGLIREKYGTESEFSRAVGIGRTTLSQKLNNASDFSRSEIVKICETLEIETAEIPAYFFAV